MHSYYAAELPPETFIKIATSPTRLEILATIARSGRVPSDTLLSKLALLPADLHSHIEELALLNLVDVDHTILPKWDSYRITSEGLTINRQLQRCLTTYSE